MAETKQTVISDLKLFRISGKDERCRLPAPALAVQVGWLDMLQARLDERRPNSLKVGF